MSDFLYGIGGVIGVLGLITAIALGGAYKSGQGATFRERILSSPSLSPLLIIHYFLPYGLVVFVAFMDIMSQLPQGIWSILTGIVLMVINRTIGGSPDFPNDLCEIPGLKSFASNFMPQSLLFVSTVVFYLASFVTVSTSKGSANITAPSPSTRIGAAWGLALSTVLIQLIGIVSTPGCLTESLNIFGFSLPPFVRAILAVAIGGAVGGGIAVPLANWSITQPSYTTSSGIPITPGSTQAKAPGFVRERFQLGAGLGEMPTSSSQGDSELPVDIAKSSSAATPGDSSDQFVCEAYKNGQLVTSTLVG